MRPDIPLLDLEGQHRPIQDEIERALVACARSQRFVLGPEVERLEKGLADLCEAPHAIGVSSGTDALLVSLMALDVGPGDEVLTTAYSFFATAGVVHRLGATPVFVDVEEESGNLDPALAAERLSDRAKAIVPVHLFGRTAEMEPLEALASKRNVAVVEDAAQAVGAREARGKRAGSMGVLSALSFYPTKNLAALGDAGMVLATDARLAAVVAELRVHGVRDQDYRHERVGGNFRMDALQAAVLNVKLGRLADWTEKRRERARRYDELFGNEGLVTRGVVRLPVDPGATAGGWSGGDWSHVYHQYCIRARERDSLREHLARDGIGSAVYYPVPLPLQPCFRSLGHAPGDFPRAERLAAEALALPMFAHLTDEQQTRVVGSIRSFYRV